MVTSSAQADARLTGQLRARGQRVTSQRLLIHRVITARPQHLSAEGVHHAVRGDLPGISLPTVYATLELLEELGLVRRVAAGGGAVLFDSRTEEHGHTICRRCGTTSDIEGPASTDALAYAAASGFHPEQAQLVVFGLCARCAGPPPAR